MKKAISILLALAMILSMSITVFANEIDSETINVPASFTAGTVEIVGPDGTTTTATVYSVKLTWTAITGVSYEAANTYYYWDSENLTYVKHDSSTDAGWSDASDSFTINITNQSNDAITADAAFVKADGIGATVNCTFENNDCTIASAAPTQAEVEAGKLAGAAKSDTITADITASGTLNSGVTSVGTITITIASA